MKTIIQAMLEEIYTKADELAKGMEQTVTEEELGNGVITLKRPYYVTLEQLEAILKEFEG